MQIIFSPRAQGFTLVELLVVLAIIAVLSTLIFTVSRNVQSRSGGAKCLANMRQIGGAFLLYTQDHDGQLPGRVTEDGDKWPILMQDYLGSPDVYACPDDERNYLRTKADPLVNQPNHTSYLFNGFNDQGAFEDASITVRMAAISAPSKTLLLAEQNPGGRNFYMDFEEGNHRSVLNKTRHQAGANYLFCDGSARRIAAVDYRDELWLVDQGYPIPDAP